MSASTRKKSGYGCSLPEKRLIAQLDPECALRDNNGNEQFRQRAEPNIVGLRTVPE